VAFPVTTTVPVSWGYTSQFYDETGKAWTVHGGAYIGPDGGVFDGTGWVDTPDHADFNVGNGDFRIDLMVTIPTSGDFYLVSQDSDGEDDFSFIVACDGAGGGLWCAVSASSGWGGDYRYTEAGNHDIFDGQPHHVALTRNGNTLTLSMDDVTVGTPMNVTGFTIANSGQRVTLGSHNGLDLFLIGRINGWRLNADAVPPAIPFPLDANTKSLVLMNELITDSTGDELIFADVTASNANPIALTAPATDSGLQSKGGLSGEVK
jgi:hypothetical protein